MILLIPFSIIILILFIMSVIIVIRLLRLYTDLRTFFEAVEDDVNESYTYFNNLCNMHLLMNDPYVMEMIGRLKHLKDRFANYAREVKKQNEKIEE